MCKALSEIRRRGLSLGTVGYLILPTKILLSDNFVCITSNLFELQNVSN